jgi:hypothetical protein
MTGGTKQCHLTIDQFNVPAHGQDIGGVLCERHAVQLLDGAHLCRLFMICDKLGIFLVEQTLQHRRVVAACVGT